jgi:colicin import membrane protein
MKRLVVAGIVFAGALGSAGAAAQPADEHGAATAIVQGFEGDAKHAAVVADAVRAAKDALERATRLRVAGDEAHAKAADGLAYEWAEMARDTAKAADAEAAAADLRKKALEAQAQLERSRSLVEEAIASIGRLQAELDQATSKDAGTRGRTAVEVHDGEPSSKDGAKKDDGKKGGGKGPKKDAPKKDVGGTP